MWRLELMDALEKFWKAVDWTTTLIKKIGPAVDGIVIETTGGDRWKYYNMTRTLEKLKPWREQARRHENGEIP